MEARFALALSRVVAFQTLSLRNGDGNTVWKFYQQACVPLLRSGLICHKAVTRKKKALLSRGMPDGNLQDWV
jgi:hypothetical protein